MVGSMMTVGRRAFLQFLTSAAFTAALPASIERALAIPAHQRKGTIEDIEHIVILMQENRAFDHYFGTLRGVRGFGDPRVMALPSGQPVWFQPDGDGVRLPFHPSTPDFGLAFLEDTPHGWPDTHAAWNAGKYDQWIASKGRTVMAHYTRQDIPFFYALADAFTICDAYHCSFLGATDPNRYHMWTGWVGNDGQGGGPVINNAEAGYDWSTYPERLERNGISWKIYQDIGDGLDAEHFWGFTDDAYIGNFGDNSLLYFHQYQNAKPGEPLYEKALRGTNLAVPGTPFEALFTDLREDVRRNRLPQVSWVVAPEAFSEHGNWPPNYGSWYVSQVLDALTSNREVWSKTALFLTYDENDGFFDHMVPPTPPFQGRGRSTADASLEIFAGSPGNPTGPYGLGIRVPMIVISPWSTGGWVCSELFDHTSLIRFIERRFAGGRADLIESNVTPWRRAICGDLTSAFDFARPNAAPAALPDTAAYEPQNHERHPDFVPTPPAQQALPVQEPGLRPARALPYELNADGSVDVAHGAFRIGFTNTGDAGVCFQVRSGLGDGPWTYTVEAGKSLADAFDATSHQGRYDLSVFGPNGFLRVFQGTVAPGARGNLDVDVRYEGDGPTIVLEITNLSRARCRVNVANGYGGDAIARDLRPGQSLRHGFGLARSFGWYDLVIQVDTDPAFARRLAGHVENGRDSVSDPAIRTA
jgi:phospholipase C